MSYRVHAWGSAWHPEIEDYVTGWPADLSAYASHPYVDIEDADAPQIAAPSEVDSEPEEPEETEPDEEAMRPSSRTPTRKKHK